MTWHAGYRGTRVNPNGDGSRKNYTWFSGFTHFFFGCGWQPHEPFVHFVGRALCCRPYVTTEYLDELNDSRNGSADSDDKGDKFDWRVVSTATLQGERHLSVRCETVDVLLTRLGQLQSPAELEESGIVEGRGEDMMDEVLEKELTGLFAEALSTCPELLDCNAAWCQHWNGSLEVCLNVPAFPPTTTLTPDWIDV